VSDESLVGDEHRSDLSSDEDVSFKSKDRQEADVSPHSALKSKDGNSPICLDQTIKSSILKTQLLQFGLIDDRISRIEEESKSDKKSERESQS